MLHAHTEVQYNGNTAAKTQTDSTTVTNTETGWVQWESQCKHSLTQTECGNHLASNSNRALRVQRYDGLPGQTDTVGLLDQTLELLPACASCA